MKCRTERLAFLLRQDITGTSCTAPWESSAERDLYRQAVLKLYERFRSLDEHPDGFKGDKGKSGN
jgi:hypothetical protein